MSKGSQRRPKQISEEEWSLRYDLAFGKITREEFDKKLNDLNISTNLEKRRVSE